jgi:uncharacterized protein YbbC (DUF1343 family)
MSGAFRPLPLTCLVAAALGLAAMIGCSGPSTAKKTPPEATPTAPNAPSAPSAQTEAEKNAKVMLGIDVLEADGFAQLKGKKVGLLTHPAGVNRRGESTVDVLRRAAGVQLVALFGPEHGIYGDAAAAVNIANTTDKRTGLPVFSLYGPTKRPTKAMLKGIDALVIDLQDIGTRSYTFVSAMRWAMEGCFENGVEVIVLDRPNPLGGLKVDGPPLDEKWAKENYVGAFRVPYVHGLTIGELARMAKEAPGVMAVTDAVRAKGKLTVVPMRGWTRAMRWPETGLTWVKTSGLIQDWMAVQGYPMTGLGTYFDPKTKVEIGFFHGVGTHYPFRGLSHRSVKLDTVEKDLRALNLPGIQFIRVSAPDRNGRPAIGLFITINDYDEWRPVELNFYLMRLACKYAPANPFAPAAGRDFSGFLRHMGSQAFLNDLAAKGAKVDVEGWIRTWREQAKVYQEQSKRYWLYR